MSNYGWFINHPFFNDIPCEVPHVILTRVKEPSYRGGLVFKFAMPVIGPVYAEIC